MARGSIVANGSYFKQHGAKFYLSKRFRFTKAINLNILTRRSCRDDQTRRLRLVST